MPFRDASFEADGFQLQAIDVIRGVERAVRNNVLVWSNFDLEWFEYCDHPGTADLHSVVPNKFVAFKGPKKTGAFHRQTGVSHCALCPVIFPVPRLSADIKQRCQPPFSAVLKGFYWEGGGSGKSRGWHALRWSGVFFRNFVIDLVFG